MAIDLTILEHQFFDPCWEPNDTSILDDASGRIKVFCHYSHRIIAWVDVTTEAWIVINRARLGAILRDIKADNLGPDDFLFTWYAPKIQVYREYLREKGYPDSNGAPEIEGADMRNAMSSGGAFIKRCLGVQDEVVLSSHDHLKTATIRQDDEDYPVDVSGLQAFMERYIAADDFIELEGNVASIPLDNGGYAKINVSSSEDGGHTMTISRMSAFQPKYPHVI